MPWPKGKPRVFAPEHRAKLSLARMGIVYSDETRAKMSAAKKGKPGRKLYDWEREGLRLRMKHRVVTVETRAKMRAAKLGKPSQLRHRVFYNGIWFRSSWEVRVAKAFDRLGIAWEYEPKRFDLGAETYLPDFYLPEEGMYVEVKGWFTQQSQTTVSRFFDQSPAVPLAILLKPQMEALERIAATANGQ